MLNDTAIGYLVLGIGIVAVLAVVFAISARERPADAPGAPPRGVHLPPPSWLPVVLAVGAGLLGAGLAFKPQDVVVNLWLVVPGLLVFVAGVVAWVRAANHEWREVERGAHDHEAGH